jgi:hypothetical protein
MDAALTLLDSLLETTLKQTRDAIVSKGVVSKETVNSYTWSQHIDCTMQILTRVRDIQGGAK